MKIYFHLNIEGFSNCYVIGNELTGEAIIVDPGIITPQIIDTIEEGGYKLAGVLVTHNHGSHVHGLETLRKIYTPQIFAADWEVAGSETYVLKDEGIIQIAGLTVGYMSVPGHTPDSMVYKIGSVLFTGDVMSAGKIGSSNNKFSEKALIKNINEKILSQQEDTILMPGHGPPTTVGAEKLFNVALNPRNNDKLTKLGLN
ncbi:MAG: MBL fold metallo-hydrolase [Treponema sp.]|nr:MBL fold metallo-hydrolase [Candidatus Treponema scatequi]